MIWRLLSMVAAASLAFALFFAIGFLTSGSPSSFKLAAIFLVVAAVIGLPAFWAQAMLGARRK